MKILMVGALYFANFGDLLFSKLFYNELLKKHPKSDIYIYETPVYKLNKACRKELSYENHFRLSMLKDMDAVVYISGGYFCIRKTSVKAHFAWYMKYTLPGNYFAKHNKKIYVLGVGGGDYVWKPGERISRRILNTAEVVCVRNIETKQKLEDIGVSADICVHSDTAHALSLPADVVPVDTATPKYIYLHVLPQEDKLALMMENIIPAVKEFVAENGQYKVLVGNDGLMKEKHKDILRRAVSYLGSDVADFCDYHSVDDLISVLAKCDLIVTPKLHAGIVGCTLGKSVLSFPIDHNKTHRYYKDIGYPERCFPLRETGKDRILEALRTFAKNGIIVPQDKIESAKGTLQFCHQIDDEGHA